MDTAEENVTAGLVRMQNRGPVHEGENESETDFLNSEGIFSCVMPVRSNLVFHSSLQTNCNSAGSQLCEDFRTQGRA